MDAVRIFPVAYGRPRDKLLPQGSIVRVLIFLTADGPGRGKMDTPDLPGTRWHTLTTQAIF